MSEEEELYECEVCGQMFPLEKITACVHCFIDVCEDCLDEHESECEQQCESDDDL